MLGTDSLARLRTSNTKKKQACKLEISHWETKH